MKSHKHRITYLSAIAIWMLTAALLSACSGRGDGDNTVADTTVSQVIPETTAISETMAVPKATIASETTVIPKTTLVPETTPIPETNEALTEPETISPQDMPKTEVYDTDSDLVLLEYIYESAGAQDVNDGILPTARDVLSDTWTATDGAARTLPTDTTKVSDDSLVGIFYFLWRDQDQNTLNPIPPTDHYKAYLEGGMDKLWEEMQVGGEGHPHYWAEPYFGYYSSNDEWVLRKHAYMFAEAGIDFVFFDITNNNIHERSFMALLKVWDEVRKEGYEVPKIVFMCGSYTAEFNELWEKVYAPGLYEELWFYWDGKPLLMLTGSVDMSPEQRDFFTIRVTWANSRDQWYTSRKGLGCWLWNECVPQQQGRSPEGDPEQIVIMCGYGANGSWGTNGGRSYYRHIPKYEGDWNMGFALMETTTGLGLLFQHQFEVAIDKHPPILLITGWNEWIAGRWSGAGAGAAGLNQTIANEYVVSGDPNAKESTYFVDNLNPEYSRDIEPMKGGFGDNYFYQMTDYIRRYKGARVVETAFGQWAIDINGSVGQWYAVGPEYRDYEGDIATRHSPGHVGGDIYGFYENDTGRNDFVTAKVSTDSKYLYFYVETASDITSPEGSNWMNLYISIDQNYETGWYGFDFILNRERDGETVSVQRFINNAWEFETVGHAEYVLNGNVMQIKISRDMIGFVDTMDFKWADNSVDDGKEIMEFIDLGDCAPNDRFTYRFTLLETGADEKMPACLTEDMVVLKSNSYNALVDGKQVRIVANNTHGVMKASDHAFWLPVSFMEETLGISCEDQETMDHYGIAYVRADELVTAAGKAVTIESNGLVVISGKPIEDQSILRVLYRVLS